MQLVAWMVLESALVENSTLPMMAAIDRCWVGQSHVVSYQYILFVDKKNVDFFPHWQLVR